jgi:sugar phosphate isomerase/epimerase
VSLSQLTTLRWSLVDEVIQLKSANYDAIGLWRPKIAEIGEELSRELLRDAGLAVASLSFAGGFTGTNGLSFRDAIADARDAIADAELLGAENLIVVSGARNGHTLRHSRRLLIDALLELADQAGSSGVRLCVMPMHGSYSRTWTYLNSLNDAVDVVREVGHPAVGLAFDTYQLWQEPGIVERIPEVAPLTGVVQISDSRRLPRSDVDRCLPGDGCIPLGEMVRAFQRSGFDGYYDVQVWSNSTWSGDYTAMSLQCRKMMQRLADQPVAMSR